MCMTNIKREILRTASLAILMLRQKNNESRFHRPIAELLDLRTLEEE